MADPFLGEIRTFGFSFPPSGWAACNGAQLSIAQNSALFSLLGTTYGGNGTTTFALPNLQGRRAINQGQLPGGQSYQLGQVGGTESTTLTTNNLPTHTHTFSASTVKATAQVPAAGSFLAKSTDSTGTVAPLIYVPAGSEGTTVALGGVGPAGGSLPFSNLDPYLTLNMCIALNGIFPSRN